MSDEAAFLSALKANPADDTARLVYADWLDEHDEPQKAEYLRFVACVAQTAPAVDLEAATTQRLLDAEIALPSEWRDRTGARFDLLLTGYTDKIATIKAIRAALGIGLGASKIISELLPAGLLVAGCLTSVVAVVRALGTTESMQLLVQTCDCPGCVIPRLFYPAVEPWPIGLTTLEEDRQQLLAAVESTLGADAAKTVFESRGVNQSVLIRVPISVYSVWRLRSALAARPNARPDYRGYVGVTPAPKSSHQSVN